jgi:hypothetical protein
LSAQAKPYTGEEEETGFAISSDRQSMGQIQMFMTYAALALARGDYDNALLNTEFLWQRLPNKIKSQYERPMDELKEKLEKMPTEEDLWNDERWQFQFGGRFKAEARYLEDYANRIKVTLVNDCLDKFNKALDDAGLSWKTTGGGLEVFGNYGDVTKGMSFEAPEAP